MMRELIDKDKLAQFKFLPLIRERPRDVIMCREVFVKRKRCELLDLHLMSAICAA